MEGPEPPNVCISLRRLHLWKVRRKFQEIRLGDSRARSASKVLQQCLRGMMFLFTTLAVISGNLSLVQFSRQNVHGHFADAGRFFMGTDFFLHPIFHALTTFITRTHVFGRRISPSR